MKLIKVITEQGGGQQQEDTPEGQLDEAEGDLYTQAVFEQTKFWSEPAPEHFGFALWKVVRAPTESTGTDPEAV